MMLYFVSGVVNGSTGYVHGVSAKEYDLLSNSCSKIVFFCSLCCPKVPLVLKIDDANHSVSSNYEILHEAITDLSTEIKNLKSSDNELQKNIKETTAALSTINTMYQPANGVPATSSSVAMNVVKELEDKECRKNNLIFYNVSEPVNPSWKVDSEYITNLCKLTFNLEVKIIKSFRLGKRVVNKHRPQF